MLFANCFACFSKAFPPFPRFRNSCRLCSNEYLSMTERLAVFVEKSDWDNDNRGDAYRWLYAIKGALRFIL